MVRYEGWNFYSLRQTFYRDDCRLASHWHNSLELSYVVEGEKWQSMEGKTIYAPKGTLLLVNSCVPHSLYVRKGLQGIVLLIDFEAFETFCHLDHSASFDLSLSPQKQPQLIGLLLEMCRLKTAGQTARVHQIMMDLLLLLKESFCTPGQKRPGQSLRSCRGGSICSLVTEYLETHYSQKITLELLEEKIGYSRAYLCELFRQEKGCSIFDYLRDFRVKKAGEDLLESQECITDIAFRHGFSTIQTFNRSFRRVYGCSPREYRHNAWRKPDPVIVVH